MSGNIQPKASKFKIGCGVLGIASVVGVGLLIFSSLNQDAQFGKDLNAYLKSNSSLSIEGLYPKKFYYEKQNIQPDLDILLLKNKEIALIPPYVDRAEKLSSRRSHETPKFAFASWEQSHKSTVDAIWKLIDESKVKSTYYKYKDRMDLSPKAFPEILSSREMVNFVLSEAERARDEGRLGDSIRILKRSIPYLKLVYFPQVELAALIRYQNQLGYFKEIRKLASSPGVNFDELKALAKDLEFLHEFLMLRIAVSTDVGMEWNILPTEISKQKVVSQANYLKTKVLDTYLVQAASLMKGIKDYGNEINTNQELSKVENEISENIILSSFHVNVFKDKDLFQAMYRREAEENITLQTIEAFRIHQKTGQFPTNLPILGSKISVDPINGKQLGYQSGQGGFSIWTVNNEGIDPYRILESKSLQNQAGVNPQSFDFAHYEYP